MVIALYGELGVGKTVFIRGAVQAMEVSAIVSSPSYLLMKSYSGRLPVYHFDFYRLSGAEDPEELGFGEYLPGEGVAFVEWADRFPHIYGGDYLAVYMERFYDHFGEGRRIKFDPTGASSTGLLDALAGSITWHLDGRLEIE